MPKKPSLSEQLGQRRTEQHAPEPVKPENPLLALQQAVQQQGMQEEKPARTHARMHARPQAARKASGNVSAPEMQREVMTGEEYADRLKNKKHLAPGSFRYQVGELEEMEAIYRELESLKPGRMSKNDIARLALILLCDAYRSEREASILVRVLKRM